jgi:hypothetical protein
LVHCGYGHWIELFNGATWPNAFVPVAAEVVGPPGSPFVAGGQRGFWFFLVLGTRTFINLGVLLSAVPAVLGVYWLVIGGVEMVKKLAAVGRARDLALAAEMIRDLSKAGISLSEEAEDQMLKTAQGFSDSVMGKRMAAMVQEQSEGQHHNGASAPGLDPNHSRAGRKPYA